MRESNTGGPAFPLEHSRTSSLHDGMTLRDYFAAKAMQAFVSAWAETKQYPETDLVVAEHAYRLADAMLEVRAR